MARIRKADAGHIGSKSKTTFTGYEIEAFPYSDYTESLESLQENIERMMRPAKIVRCYRCLSCDRSYSASRMSSLLILCRDCCRTAQDKGPIARRNQIDRIKNAVSIFLKRRLDAK